MDKPITPEVGEEFEWSGVKFIRMNGADVRNEPGKPLFPVCYLSGNLKGHKGLMAHSEFTPVHDGQTDG